MNAAVVKSRIETKECSYPGVTYYVLINGGEGMFATPDESEAHELCAAINSFRENVRKIGELEIKVIRLKKKINRLRGGKK